MNARRTKGGYRRHPSDPVNGVYQVKFSYNGVTYGHWSIGTRKEGDAIQRLRDLETRIYNVENGHEKIPPGVNIGRYLLFGPSIVPNSKPKSIEELVTMWLEVREKQTRMTGRKHRSIRAYGTDFSRMNKFTNWLKTVSRTNKTLSTDHLSDPLLTAYKNYILKTDLAGSSQWHCLRVVRVFAKWVKKNHKASLPHKIDLEDYDTEDVDKSTIDPEWWDVEDIKTLLDNANDRTKLYILLALNLGYRASDIAKMEHSMWDPKTDIISRIRGKTRTRAPQPQFGKLWPETKKLLKQEMTNPGTSQLMLLNTNGNPLVTEKIVDGKVKISDNIASAFNKRLRTKCSDKLKKPLAFENFRATGSQLIMNNSLYLQYGEIFSRLYLADGSDGVLKHYAQRKPPKEFYEVVDWMGKELGIVKKTVPAGLGK